MNSNKEQHETRERILFAAKKEFADKGYAGARMCSIAKRAKANQALIHYYFENKENLYIQVLHRLLGIEKDKFIPDLVNQFNLTSSQKFLVALYFFVHLHMEGTDPDFNAILTKEAGDGKKYLKELVLEFLMPRLERFSSIIDDGIQNGEFETSSSIFVVMETIHFILIHEANREIFADSKWQSKLYGKDSKEKLLNFIIEFTFKGLCPRGKIYQIPEIPENVKQVVDDTIKRIKEELKGGAGYEE